MHVATLGLAVLVLLTLAAIRWGARGCLSWLVLLLIGWIIYDAAHRVAQDVAQRLLDQLARDINSIIGALSTALALSGRAAGAAVVVSAALDFADVVLRIRNAGARRDTSRGNLVGTFASAMNMAAKSVLADGLAGGGPVVTGVGIAMIITAELLKLALVHTNSLSEYRQLLLDLWDLVRSAGRGAP